MKLLKRAAALCMAAAMAMSLSVTAFAAKGDVVSTGTLTVTGDQLINKDVTAIRMFTARATQGSDTENASYVFDSYELEDKWLDFFKTTIGKDALNVVDEVSLGANPTNDEYKDAAIKYVASLSNDDQNKGTLADFAEKAQNWARSQNTSGNYFDGMITTKKATAASANPGETKGTTTFNGLIPGYYLVYPEMGGTGNNSRNTDAMLINIPTNKEGATWNIKSTYPTVEKKVDDGNTVTGSGNADNGSAQVGDVVTFTLTSAVPDTSDYETYVFQFTDKLPNGLTLVNKENETTITQNDDFNFDDITLTIGGYNIARSHVNVTVKDGSADDSGKKILTVKIDDLTAADLVTEGTVNVGNEIVLTYKAKVNENAVTTDPVTNEASVQYSNDPNGTGLGTSTPDESTVYTYDIDVHKYAKDNESGYLANAVFALSANGSLGELKQEQINSDTDSIKEQLIPLKDNSDSTNGTSYVVDPGGTNYTFTTNGNSAIKVQGLEAGTYYLYEVTAPASYNKLKEPVKIEIRVSGAEVGGQTPSYTNPVYIIYDKDGEQVASSSVSAEIKVENNQGITLPETGSIGTIGLTVAGVAIVLVGVFAPRKKKENQE